MDWGRCKRKLWSTVSKEVEKSRRTREKGEPRSTATSRSLGTLVRTVWYCVLCRNRIEMIILIVSVEASVESSNNYNLGNLPGFVAVK